MRNRTSSTRPSDRVRYNWGDTDVLKLANVCKDLEDFYQVISCDDNYRLLLLRKYEEDDEHEFKEDEIGELAMDLNALSYETYDNIMKQDFGQKGEGIRNHLTRNYNIYKNIIYNIIHSLFHI
jgi:hypothetical protein